MGGGDLNLKKSWHPHTLKNQEKVWKAEQQKQHEDNKITELQRELKEERLREELEEAAIQSGKIQKNDNSKLNWMYKGPGSHVSREEYLLGRKIDKAFELLHKEETQENEKQEQTSKSSYTVEHEINPEMVIQKDGNNVQVDMKRKLMEDPLLMIRQDEEATKRAITSNPVKMKQLQLLISSLKEKKKKKKKKKHKNVDSESRSKKKKKEKKKKKDKSTKKKKKHSKKESSESEDSSRSKSECDPEPDDDTSDEEKALRREKLKKLIERETKRVTELRLLQAPNESTLKRSRSRSQSPSDKRSYSREKVRKEEHHTSKREKEKSRLERSRSRSRERRNSRKRRKSEEEEKHSRHEGEKRGHKDGKKREDGEKRGHEEMKRKREEMIQNAAKRETQRKEKVDSHKEELKREEEEEKNAHGFVKKLGSSVSASVESRIRSKVGSLQKGNEHMSTNFVKK